MNNVQFAIEINGNNHVILSQGDTRFITMRNGNDQDILKINNITLQGFSDEEGGSIYVNANGCNIELSGVTFLNSSTTSRSGGAILMVGANLNIQKASL